MAFSGRLLATSDLHLNHRENRAALDALPEHPDDWLIVAGDIGSKAEHLSIALDALVPRFARVIWVPGNHDLWTPRDMAEAQRGVAHYERLIALCHTYGVLTPEDPFALWPGDGPRRAIVPLFLLYDYSFAPDEVGPEGAVVWARQGGVRSADEDLLHPFPYATRAAWCHARVEAAAGPVRRYLVFAFFPGRPETGGWDQAVGSYADLGEAREQAASLKRSGKTVQVVDTTTGRRVE